MTRSTLYDRPANDFVMWLPRARWPGSAGSWCDRMTSLSSVIASRRSRSTPRCPGRPESIEAVVERVVRLGFEVRVDLRADSGERFAAQITRRDAADLQLSDGETVFARAGQHSSVIDREIVAAV